MVLLEGVGRDGPIARGPRRGRSGYPLNRITRSSENITFPTLKEVQPILTFATVAKNSDWSFNMGVYEFFFLLF